MKRLSYSILLAAVALALVLPATLLASMSASSLVPSQSSTAPGSSSPEGIPFLIHKTRFVDAEGLSELQMQKVLDDLPGSLKAYRVEVEGKTYSAARTLLNASFGYGYTVNPRVLLVIMELASGLVTSPNTRPEQFDHTLASRSGIPDGLGNQLRWLSDKLGQTYLTYVTTLSDEQVANAASLAVRDVLTDLAKSSPGSALAKGGSETFIQVYLKMFGVDPRQPLQVNQAEVTPFFRKPFAQQYQLNALHGAMNSLFDHEFPTYAKDGYVMLFTGEHPADPANVPCTFGVNCYDGHDGIDYNTSTQSILAAAEGDISAVCRVNIPGCPTGYSGDALGNLVAIRHGEGYETVYGHLGSIGGNPNVTPSRSWQPGDHIQVGQDVGTSDCSGTGCSGNANHLHFWVRRNGVSVDPFGWWSTNNDPWANDNRGAPSYWLWQAYTVTDDRDPAFERFRHSGWNDLSSGFLGHAWWTGAISGPKENWGIWGLFIPQNGRYSIQVYIPTAPQGQQWTTAAQYSVIYRNAQHVLAPPVSATLNQTNGHNNWLTLVRDDTHDKWFDFQGNTTVAVILTNVTSDATTTPQPKVVFDAVRLPGAIDAGLQYLRNHQRSDGGWGESQSSTGITALAALAFLSYGFDERDITDTDGDGTPDVQEAIRFLLNHYDSGTGRFSGDAAWGEPMYNYDTSLGLLVLITADRTNTPHKYNVQITKAKDYLLSIQSVESNGYTPSNPNYGGWGYPRNNWSDLSNTQWTVMALDAAYKYLNLTKPDPNDTNTWTYKVLRYADSLQRSDGGFDYRVGYFNQSVGSMTHAGIWTNLLAGRDPTHTRVQQALNWVQTSPHWSVTENPGRGSAALYYYYVTMAKSLAMARKTTLTVGGTSHDWFRELYTELTTGGHKPHSDGYWYNTNTGEWESDENLVTAYAILALETHMLPPGVPLSMSIILHSPADLHLYDALGRHTGKNYDTGQIDLQIPGSTYSEAEPKTITVSQPEAGNYTVQLIGTGSGNYTLDIVGRQSGAVVSSVSYPGTITSGAAQGSFLSVTAIEGALTIFSTPPEPLPVMMVQPSSLTLQGAPGSILHGTFAVQETGAARGIQGISIFASDLTDGSGHTIPGSSITFQPSTFDLAAGASQNVAVTIPTDSALPDGSYSGRVTIESVNAGAKAVQIVVNLSSAPSLLPDKFLFAIGAQSPVEKFRWPGRLAVAADGTVYVTEGGNNRIQRFSGAGNFLGTWGSLGNGDGKFNGINGVAVATDGTVYVADQGNHRIQRFTATGSFLGQWGSQGSGNGLFNGPGGMAVAADGTVYVADIGNQRIQRFTATGSFLGQWGSQGSGNGQFSGPQDVAVAADGTVYVADTGNHRIQRFTATGSFLGQWGGQGSGNGQFAAPYGLAVAPDGTVYVADSYNNRIQRFTSTGSFLGAWGGTGGGDGQFAVPTGVAVAVDGTVYVTDNYHHRIQRFTASGSFLGKWGSWGLSDGQFTYAAGVAVAADGSFYVADLHNNRIQRFSGAGSFLGKWGSPGSGDGEFSGPFGVAVATDGTVYVADTSNHRIQRFTATGQFLGKWGSQGSGDGQFNGPWGVALAPDGTVYVADTDNHRIQRFSATGQFLSKWGSQGGSDGQFAYPRRVAVAPDGTVYVADKNNHRIQRFSATGQFLGKWGSPGSGDGQFIGPSGVAVAPDGTVYVADTENHRIQRFTATGQFLGKWGSYGSGDVQFIYPFGVAVAPDGTVYVADTNNNRIQAFGPTYPATWRGEYFANRWLTEAPVLIRQESAIDFNWGTSSPGSGVPVDSFSARWQRYVLFDADTYRFTVFTDDGVRLWVDDKLLIEAWQDPQVATYSADISLTQGYHRVRLEYYEAGGSAAVRLSWGPATQVVTIAVIPASKAATVGEIFTLDIKLNTGSQPVDSVDSYLSFDRNYLRVVDVNGNETNSIIPGTTLPVVLQNSADNSQGRITYSAGKQLGGVSPSGDFVLATIRFKAIAVTGGTNITFLSGTGVFYQGNSLPIFTNNGSVQIQQAISLKGRVTLQGRGNPPDNRWSNFPLAVTLYSPGGTSPVGSYTANTDASGYFTVTGITQGTYDAKVKNAHTLSNKKNNVAVPTGSTAVDFGTLLEGDANNDDNIGGADYSILATAYSKCSGQSGWDSRADFNGSGCIEGADYSLLASNYGRHGPIALAITVMGPVETEVITGSVVISVDPSSKSVSPGTVFTLDIKIAAGGQVVDSVDSYLSFDRDYLRVVDASGNETNSIVPGTALPVVLQNSADNSQGRIAYSAGKQLGGVSPSGDFVLATIRFKVIAAPPGGGTAITFQSGTDAFYEGNSVLGTLVNGAVSAGYRIYLPVILRVYQSW